MYVVEVSGLYVFEPSRSSARRLEDAIARRLSQFI